MSLVARHLEAAGIPTVIIGSGRDIVEQAAVPRFLFVDFPLGNPTGKPNDVEMQRAIVGLGLDVLERAFVPQTTVQAPFVWSEDHSWRDRFMEVTPELAAELRAAGEARRQKQAQNKKRFAAD
ncbi:MAG: hypothetical protein AAF531_05810 [Actinomycetota bacterium]